MTNLSALHRELRVSIALALFPQSPEELALLWASVLPHLFEALSTKRTDFNTSIFVAFRQVSLETHPQKVAEIATCVGENVISPTGYSTLHNARSLEDTIRFPGGVSLRQAALRVFAKNPSAFLRSSSALAPSSRTAFSIWLAAISADAADWLSPTVFAATSVVP